MLYEFCAENVTLLEKAMKAGAQRIELCDNLAVGVVILFTLTLRLRLCWLISKKPRKLAVRE